VVFVSVWRVDWSSHGRGNPVPGAPQVTASPRPSSTAFLADAEVWCYRR
jgi:hypothetical protein